MIESPEPSTDLQQLRARAALFRALAVGISPPQRDHALRVAELLSNAPTNGPEALNQALETARAAWCTSRQETLAEDYDRVLGPQGACPTCEREYRPGGCSDAALAELAALYMAFGFGLLERIRERPDDLRLQLEFFASLFEKQINAMSRGWATRAALAEQARANLIAEHLSIWLPRFAEALARADAPAALRTLAHLGELLLQFEQQAMSAVLQD